MFLKIKELPEMIQSVLKSNGYGKPDIQIVVCESVKLGSSGGMTGIRDFTILLNLSTGETKRFNGSWGGSNPFNPENPVDNDETEYNLPSNGLVIKGFEGYGPSHAKIYVSSLAVVPSLEHKQVDLSQDEKQILQAMVSYKAFARMDYITGYMAEDKRNGYRRMSEIEAEQAFQSLATKGFIKINKAGSKSITTEGKNALSMVK
jgi:hypothetical protein